MTTAATAYEHVNSPCSIKPTLASDGYCYLPNRCHSLAQFNSLVNSLCSNISFDPAREKTGKAHQMVNAGLGEIGLHIENGNTPKPPRLVVFYCQRAASAGSETTLCDGSRLLSDLAPEWNQRLSRPMTVTRTVPGELWLNYLSKEFKLDLNLNDMNPQQFDRLLKQFPNVKAQLQTNGDLLCTIKFDPLRKAAYSKEIGFANALLGPSVNYEQPIFRFSDGSLFSERNKQDLTKEAEKHTREITWKTGDVVLIDNWRVLHGRRAIKDPNRALHIAMGDLR